MQSTKIPVISNLKPESLTLEQCAQLMDIDAQFDFNGRNTKLKRSMEEAEREIKESESKEKKLKASNKEAAKKLKTLDELKENITKAKASQDALVEEIEALEERKKTLETEMKPLLSNQTTHAPADTADTKEEPSAAAPATGISKYFRKLTASPAPTTALDKQLLEDPNIARICEIKAELSIIEKKTETTIENIQKAAARRMEYQDDPLAEKLDTDLSTIKREVADRILSIEAEQQTRQDKKITLTKIKKDQEKIKAIADILSADVNKERKVFLTEFSQLEDKIKLVSKQVDVAAKLKQIQAPLFELSKNLQAEIANIEEANLDAQIKALCSLVTEIKSICSRQPNKVAIDLSERKQNSLYSLQEKAANPTGHYDFRELKNTLNEDHRISALKKLKETIDTLKALEEDINDQSNDTLNLLLGKVKRDTSSAETQKYYEEACALTEASSPKQAEASSSKQTKFSWLRQAFVDYILLSEQLRPQALKALKSIQNYSPENITIFRESKEIKDNADIGRYLVLVDSTKDMDTNEKVTAQWKKVQESLGSHSDTVKNLSMHINDLKFIRLATSILATMQDFFLDFNYENEEIETLELYDKYSKCIETLNESAEKVLHAEQQQKEKNDNQRTEDLKQILEQSLRVSKNLEMVRKQAAAAEEKSRLEIEKTTVVGSSLSNGNEPSMTKNYSQDDLDLAITDLRKEVLEPICGNDVKNGIFNKNPNITAEKQRITAALASPQDLEKLVAFLQGTNLAAAKPIRKPTSNPFDADLEDEEDIQENLLPKKKEDPKAIVAPYLAILDKISTVGSALEAKCKEPALTVAFDRLTDELGTLQQQYQAAPDLGWAFLETTKIKNLENLAKRLLAVKTIHDKLDIFIEINLPDFDKTTRIKPEEEKNPLTGFEKLQHSLKSEAVSRRFATTKSDEFIPGLKTCDLNATETKREPSKQPVLPEEVLGQNARIFYLLETDYSSLGSALTEQKDQLKTLIAKYPNRFDDMMPTITGLFENFFGPLETQLIKSHTADHEEEKSNSALLDQLQVDLHGMLNLALDQHGVSNKFGAEKLSIIKETATLAEIIENLENDYDKFYNKELANNLKEEFNINPSITEHVLIQILNDKKTKLQEIVNKNVEAKKDYDAIYPKREHEQSINDIIKKFNLLLSNTQALPEIKNRIRTMVNNHTDYMAIQGNVLNFSLDQYSEFLKKRSLQDIRKTMNEIKTASDKLQESLNIITGRSQQSYSEIYHGGREFFCSTDEWVLSNLNRRSMELDELKTSLEPLQLDALNEALAQPFKPGAKTLDEYIYDLLQPTHYEGESTLDLECEFNTGLEAFDRALKDFCPAESRIGKRLKYQEDERIAKEETARKQGDEEVRIAREAEAEYKKCIEAFLRYKGSDDRTSSFSTLILDPLIVSTASQEDVIATQERIKPFAENLASKEFDEVDMQYRMGTKAKSWDAKFNKPNLTLKQLKTGLDEVGADIEAVLKQKREFDSIPKSMMRDNPNIITIDTPVELVRPEHQPHNMLESTPLSFVGRCMQGISNFYQRHKRAIQVVAGVALVAAIVAATFYGILPALGITFALGKFAMWMYVSFAAASITTAAGTGHKLDKKRNAIELSRKPRNPTNSPASTKIYIAVPTLTSNNKIGRLLRSESFISDKLPDANKLYTDYSTAVSAVAIRTPMDPVTRKKIVDGLPREYRILNPFAAERRERDKSVLHSRTYSSSSLRRT